MSLCITTPIQIINATNSSNKCKNRSSFRKRVSTIVIDPDDKFKILLISSRKNHDKWKLPGGGIESNESITTTAMRETLEEAGVVGRVENYIGDYENPVKKTLTYAVSFISKDVYDTWDENDRNREWFSVCIALKKLEHHDREMLFDYLYSVVL